MKILLVGNQAFHWVNPLLTESARFIFLNLQFLEPHIKKLQVSLSHIL